MSSKKVCKWIISAGSLAIREMKTKTTMRLYFIYIRVAMKGKIESLDKDEEKAELLDTHC